MGRSDYTKNNKKKWGAKMEELATMVERAQLEKIQWNKKAKKKSKLSKKDYLEADEKDVTRSENNNNNSNNNNNNNNKIKKGKGKEKEIYGKDKQKGQHKVGSAPQTPFSMPQSPSPSLSKSCPETPGFFSSNKGRSISFTGGPHFSYSQFHYSYTHEDNYGKKPNTTTTTTTAITTTLESTLQGEIEVTSTTKLSTSFEVVYGEYESESSSSDTSDNDANIVTDDSSDPGSSDSDDYEKMNVDDDETSSSSESSSSEQEDMGEKEDEEEDEEEEEEEDRIEMDSHKGLGARATYHAFPGDYVPFSHPDEISATSLELEFAKSLRRNKKEDTDSEDESPFERRRRMKAAERDLVLQFDSQGLYGGEDDMFNSNSNPINFSRSGRRSKTSRSNQNAFSTPQNPTRLKKKDEGPHSWPKKTKRLSNMESDKKPRNPREKKKKQTKTKGWVSGGTVKDDDLVQKLARDGDQQSDLNSVVLGHSTDSTSTTTTTTSTASGKKHTPSKSQAESHKQKTPKSTREVDETEIDSSLLTPKEEKIYQAFLTGNFKALDTTPSKHKQKSKRHPNFDLIEVARLVEDCNEFVSSGLRKSMSLPPMTKEQRIQVYALASLYKFKKESVGRGGNRIPVLIKSKKTVIPHHTVLARFVRDCVEAPHSMKELYLNLGEEGALPPRIAHAYTTMNSIEGGGWMGGSKGSRFVAENAVPLDHSNRGHLMLRLMGWDGGGLGANGEGITEPIAQKMKFSRVGLG